MKKYQFLLVFALSALFGFKNTFAWFFFQNSNPELFGTKAWVQKEVGILQPEARNLDGNVLRLSLIAYVNAKKRGLVERPILTVIDYSKPSTEKRLWVFDINKGEELFNTWVAHGKNSGSLEASSFSNNPGSLKSSIGVFVTEETYTGGKGYSLRLKGLEPGVNDNAYRRDIVIHGAWYVSPNVAEKYGQIGRSWGCPAVPTQTVKPLINTIKDDTVVFAYYPDQSWLKRSSFLVS